MPTRTKEPRRQLKVLDAAGIETIVKLERENGSTRVVFQQPTNLDPLNPAAGLIMRAKHVEHAVTMRTQPVPTIDATTGAGLTPLNVVVPVNGSGMLFNAQVDGQKIYMYRYWAGDSAPRQYDAGQVPFDETTAHQVVNFVNSFTNHFESGAASQNRLLSKNEKLGRKVLVGKLRTWVNPVREADLDQQRAEHGDEDLNVYVFPDSGTDMLELENAQGSRMRPVYFVSANQLTARYMRGGYGADPELVGSNSTQLVLVRPLEGFARYVREGSNLFREAASGIVGLYALTNDLYSLLHKIHTEQQRGWTVSEHGNIDSTAVKNFPFEITLEEIGGGLGKDAAVTAASEARVEYDGKPKGVPRVRITATGMLRAPFAKRSSRTARGGLTPGGPLKARVWTATLPQLMANMWVDDEGTHPINMGIFAQRIRIRPADVQRILVALDARYERGLKGVESDDAAAAVSAFAGLGATPNQVIKKEMGAWKVRLAHYYEALEYRFRDQGVTRSTEPVPAPADGEHAPTLHTDENGLTWHYTKNPLRHGPMQRTLPPGEGHNVLVHDTRGFNMLLFRHPEFSENETGGWDEVRARAKNGEPMLIRADSYSKEDSLWDSREFLLFNGRVMPMDHRAYESFHSAWWHMLDTNEQFRTMVENADWRNPLMTVALDQILENSQQLPAGKPFTGLIRDVPRAGAVPGYEGSGDDILAQFDKATLVLVTKDPAYVSSRRSMKLKDLRFMDLRDASTHRLATDPNANYIAIDARVSDDELPIDDGSAWWPLRYLGNTNTAGLRHLAQHGKLSITAADLSTGPAEMDSFIELNPGDGEQLLVHLDQLEEGGKLGVVTQVSTTPKYSFITLKKVKVIPDKVMRGWGHRTVNKKLTFSVSAPQTSMGLARGEFRIEGRGWYVNAETLPRLQRLAAGEEVELVNNSYTYQLEKEDLQPFSVWLDGLLEAGLLTAVSPTTLSGLGAAQRRKTGTVIHLPNITRRTTSGHPEPMFPFADSCHSGGVASVLSVLKKYISQVQENILLIKQENTNRRPSHFLDEEGDKPEGQIAVLEDVLLQLRNTYGQLYREVIGTRDDVNLKTPVCFSTRKMVSTHEGTHAALALAWRTPNDEDEHIERNTAIRTATETFLMELGPASQHFWTEFGSELLPEMSRTEEVIAGIMGMSVAVRRSVANADRINQHAAANIADETAFAFSSYLKPYQRFVDAMAVKQAMWNAAAELVARYPSDTAALDSFVRKHLQKAVEGFSGVKDIKRGKVIDDTETDYSNLLPKDVKKTHRMLVEIKPENMASDTLTVHVLGRTSDASNAVTWLSGRAGYLRAVLRPNGYKRELLVEEANLGEGLRGRGVGKAMYEALYREAHALGATHVRGGTHSTLAHNVHEALAAKHGWQYEADPNTVENGGDWDERWEEEGSGVRDDKWMKYQFPLTGVKP